MMDVPSWTCQRLSCMISIIMWWLLDMDIIYIYYSTIPTALWMKFSQKKCHWICGKNIIGSIFSAPSSTFWIWIGDLPVAALGLLLFSPKTGIDSAVYLVGGGGINCWFCWFCVCWGCCCICWGFSWLCS
jgi:hypothetical protein